MNGYEPGFLPFFMQSDLFMERAQAISVGSLSPTINWGTLRTQKFQLPPVEHQKRAVEVLGAFDACIEADRDLLAELDEYRGALAHHHATAHGAKLGPTGVVPEGSLPPAWKLLTIRELCLPDPNALTLGPFGSDLVVSDYGTLTEGVPVIFVADVCRYEFRYTSNKFISAEKFERLGAHEARPGDVLVTEMGWPPGEACIVPESWPPSVIKADIIRARLDPRVMDSAYLVEIINSHWGMQQVARLAPGTTRPRMTLRDFEKITLAVPPVEAQRSILSQFEAIADARKALVDRLAETVKLRSLMLADLLRCPDVQ